MHRLFVGLRPPAPVRARLIAAMGGILGARWQDDDQLHLTLRFIGEIDPRMADDVVLALARISAPAPCVSLAGVGRFAKQGRTDTVWAGVAPHDALAALHRKVDHAVTCAGLPSDPRAYLPHITLARLGRGLGVEHQVDRYLADQAGLGSDPFAFGHLVLYESHLTREAARYHIVERWPLMPSTVRAE